MKSKIQRIYIPIWLDLLCQSYRICQSIISNLHSNMVRFIMRSMDKKRMPTMLFTFQYG